MNLSLLSQQLSEVMTIYEAGVKDMHAIIQHRPLQLTLVDAIGNYRFIPFDFCFTYEVNPDDRIFYISNSLARCFRMSFVHITTTRNCQGLIGLSEEIIQ